MSKSQVQTVPPFDPFN